MELYISTNRSCVVNICDIASLSVFVQRYGGQSCDTVLVKIIITISNRSLGYFLIGLTVSGANVETLVR